MPKVDHVFWGVAEDRNPVAATLPHNTILVVIPPPSFGRPLWRVQTRVAPPPHSQVALFTGVRGRAILRSPYPGSCINPVPSEAGSPPTASCRTQCFLHLVVVDGYARRWMGERAY